MAILGPYWDDVETTSEPLVFESGWRAVVAILGRVEPTSGWLLNIDVDFSEFAVSFLIRIALHSSYEGGNEDHVFLRRWYTCWLQ